MPRRYPYWVIIAMIIGDVILLNLAFVSAFYLRIELQLFRVVLESYNTPLADYVPLMLVLTLVLLLLFRMEGVYDLRRNTTWPDTMSTIVRSTLTTVVLVIVATFVDLLLLQSRLLLAYDAVLIVIYLGIGRAIWGSILAQLRRRGIGVARTLIVGVGEVGRTVLRMILARPELGYQVVGLVDDHPRRGETNIGPYRALGSLDNIPAILDHELIDEVIITLPWLNHQSILNIVQQCEARGVRAHIVPDLFQMTLTTVNVDELGGIPLIGTRTPSLSRTNALAKRVFDLALGIPLMLIALPFMAVIALLVKLNSPGPALFMQTRIGMTGRPFLFLKFRSMYIGADSDLAVLHDLNEASGPLFKIKADPRRTLTGRFLRRTSMDELPQLFNVLRGEMSLVGPRPPLPSEVSQYEDWHKQRLVARPGLTGLWQVSGRSDLSFDEQVLLDIYYLENWSLLLDIKILFRTVPIVLFGRGAY